MKIATSIRIVCCVTVLSQFAFTSSLRAQPAGGKWTATPQLPLLTGGRLIYADSLVGYYIGQDTGYVTKTGGLTWQKMNFPSDARPAPTYLFTPDSHTILSFQEYTPDTDGLVYPGLIESTDMGTTWIVQQQTPFFQQSGIKALSMWTANDGFAIWLDLTMSPSPVHCAATHDGGKTFSDMLGDATLQKYIGNLSGNGTGGKLSLQSDWSDNQHGVIAVTGNVTTAAYPVLLTSDGGHSWNEQYLKHKGDSTVKLSYTYTYPGSGSIWVVPLDPKVGQFYYYSSDYGKNWITSDTLKAGYISKLAPVSPTATWAFIVGSPNQVFATSNHVAYKDISGSWKYIDTLNTGEGFGGSSYSIQDIQFRDPAHGWIRAIKEKIVNAEPVGPDTAFFFRFGTSLPNSVLNTSDFPHLQCVPNPASTVMRIVGLSGDERILNITMTNTLGSQCTFSGVSAGNGNLLDLRGKPDGCYLVTVRTSLRTENLPVMVMHN